MSEVFYEGCVEMRTMAERELASFREAVTRMFGAEQARVAAEEWIEEVRTMKVIPSSVREWRAVTIRTMARRSETLNAQLAAAC